MKKDKVKSKFLEELEQVPIIAIACKKLGVSRNTYYRWCNEDIDFALAAQESLDVGVDFVNDHAQSNVLNGIKSGDLNTSKWWLSSRHKDFRRPFNIHKHSDPAESPEEYERNLKEAQERLKKFQAKWFKPKQNG